MIPKSTMRISNINNIYGESIHHAFSNIPKSVKINNAKIIYLDDPTPSNSKTTEASPSPSSPTEPTSQTGGYTSFFGGAPRKTKAAKKSEDVPQHLRTIYAAPMYIKDAYKEYIEPFEALCGLSAIFNSPNPKGIYIMPTPKRLETIKSEIMKTLDGTEHGTVEAKIKIFKHKLSYLRYLVDYHGESESNNNFDYGIPIDVIQHGDPNKIFRRCNRWAECYYVKVPSPGVLQFSTTTDMKNPTECRVLGICGNSSIFATGELPEYTKEKKKNVASMSGGQITTFESHFRNLINKYNDTTTAASKFIADAAIANSPQSIAKFYSGDPMYTAYALIYNSDNFDQNLQNNSPGKQNAAHDAIIEYYKPSKDVYSKRTDRSQMYRQALRSAFNNSSSLDSGARVNKSFIRNLNDAYQSLNIRSAQLPIDIATAVYKSNGGNKEAALTGLRYLNAIKNDEICHNKSFLSRGSMEFSDNGEVTFNGGRAKYSSTPFTTTVYSALSKCPMIGQYVMGYIPVITIPKNEKNMIGGAFDENIRDFELDGVCGVGEEDEEVANKSASDSEYEKDTCDDGKCARKRGPEKEDPKDDDDYDNDDEENSTEEDIIDADDYNDDEIEAEYA